MSVRPYRLTAPPIRALVLRLKQSIHSVVMAGLVPAIHELLRRACRFPWMPGTRPGHDGEADHETSE
jgi:hypothetical protein